jgi:DNA-binding SARP family transcriptional activator
LWPDQEGGAARDAFIVALHRLRKILGDSRAITLMDGQVSLDPDICFVDAIAFERVYDKADREIREGRGAEFVMTAGRGVGIYCGNFLAADGELPWATSMRERLRAKFIRMVGMLGRHFESVGRWDDAAGLYLRGIDADDLSEAFYQGLMRCHMQLDRKAEAMATYRRLRQTLSVTLGISPSAESEALFRRVRD